MYMKTKVKWAIVQAPHVTSRRTSVSDTLRQSFGALDFFYQVEHGGNLAYWRLDMGPSPHGTQLKKAPSAKVGLRQKTDKFMLHIVTGRSII